MESNDRWLEGKVRYPVYYEDTDFSGYVYHANYLKYFERGREELVGLPYVRDLYQRGVHFVVARMDLAFHAPAKHGDIIEVATRMRLSASPIGVVEQTASRLRTDGKAPEKLVTANIKLVAIDQTGDAIRVPQDVMDYFDGLAGPK